MEAHCKHGGKKVGLQAMKPWEAGDRLGFAADLSSTSPVLQFFLNDKPVKMDGGGANVFRGMSVQAHHSICPALSLHPGMEVLVDFESKPPEELEERPFSLLRLSLRTLLDSNFSGNSPCT